MGETPFVVHRHIKGATAHYDLMIRRGEKLATWTFPKMPGESRVEGRRLFDHRIRYLEYEGELGEGKGRTMIVDRGTCDVVWWDEKRVEAVFHGTALTGRYYLVRDEKQTWAMSGELEKQGAP